MENLCAIIEKLFNARPQPTICLKQHIGWLEEAIGKLAKKDYQNGFHLVEVYRDKVIHYWQLFEYCELSVFGDTLPPPTNDTQPFSRYGPTTIASSIPTSYDKSLHGTRASANVDSRPSPDKILSVMKSAFDKLSKIESIESDFEGMKNLLILVTKARALTMPWWKNVVLLSTIFSYAFDKLPVALQEIYNKEYNGKKKWLRDLRLFIQKEIDMFVCHRLPSKIGAGGDSKKKLKRKSKLTCFYCKLTGKTRILLT